MATLERFLSPALYVGLAEKWLVPVLVAVLVSLTLSLFKRLGLRRARVWAEKSRARFDDVLVDALGSTRSFFILGVALWAGSEYTELSARATTWLRTLISLIAILQVAIWIHVAIRRSTEMWADAHADAGARTMATGVAFVVRLCIGAMLFVMAMSAMGFEISALIAGLGIGGVAAALAVQSLLGDILASLSMLFDRPFDLGDFIVVGSEKGTVERIGLRSTRLRALDGQEIVFANGDLVKSRIHNFKRMQERRVGFTLAVDHDMTPDEVQAFPGVLRRIIEGREGLRFDRAHFSQILPSGFEFELVYFVTSPDFGVHMDHRQAINLAILGHLRGVGVHLSRTLPGTLAEPSEPDADAKAKPGRRRHE